MILRHWHVLQQQRKQKQQQKQQRAMAPGGKDCELSAVNRLKLWRENVPCFCDVAIEYPTYHAAEDDVLRWSSPTVDWVHGASGPVPECDDELQGWNSQWLVMGTATDEQEPNALLLYSVILPSSSLDAGIIAAAPCAAPAEPSSSSSAPCMEWPSGQACFRLAAALPHAGNVERARSMPQRGTLVATKSTSPKPGLYVYDLGPHLTYRSHDQEQQQQRQERADGPVLTCHSTPAPAEVGLCWNPTHEGALLSTCEQGSLAMFQMDAGLSARPDNTAARARPAAPALQPSARFHGHAGSGVNDAAFAGPWAPQLFGSVAENGTAALWDCRCGGSGSGSGAGAAPVQQWRAHSMGHTASAANCVAFSALRPQEMTTGGSEGNVKLWDLRGGSSSTAGAPSAAAAAAAGSRPPLLKVLPSHRSKVTQLAWSPHRASWLMSCDSRGLVYAWDMEGEGRSDGSLRRGRGQAPKAESLLPNRPELRMIYGGHGKEVNDLSWCPDAERGAGLVASVSAEMMGPEDDEQQGHEEAGEDEEEEEEGREAVQRHNVQIWRPSLDVL